MAQEEQNSGAAPDEKIEDTPKTPDVDVEQDDQEEGDGLPDNIVEISEVADLRKKVSVTVPRERIDAKLDEMFGELSDTAQIPGFRIGRAPRRLIEKRFGKDVSKDVRNALIGESMREAMGNDDLKIIGEPDFDLDKIEVPDTGSLTYDFEVEVEPQFDLPNLEGIEITKPAMEITDKRVDEQVESIRTRYARYEDTTDAAEKDDVVIAGAKISADGIEPVESLGLTLRVAPGQIENLPIMELGDKLSGKKAEDVVSLQVTAPASHPNDAWKDKELTVEITISTVRKQVLPDINDEFAASLGLETIDELREYIKTNLTQQIAKEVQRSMHEQISKYLLENTEFDLPPNAVERHASSVLQRRYVELARMGISKEKIDENLTELQTSAAEEAKNQLKLSFVFSKIAEKKELDVSDDEINSVIADVAAQSGQRPERVKQELNANGRIESVHDSILEDKAIEALIADAKITEEDPEKKKKEKAEKKKETPKKETATQKAEPKKTIKKETTPKKETKKETKSETPKKTTKKTTKKKEK